MITDKDITKLKTVFATKEDLKDFAKKSDLDRFATKEDLDKLEIRTGEGFADVQNQFVEVNTNISELKGEFKDLKGEFKDLKGEFKDLNGEFKEMKTQMTGMERNIITAINGIKEDIVEIKQQELITNKRLTRLEKVCLTN